MKQTKSPYTFLWSNYQPNFTIQMNINALINFRDIVWNKLDNIISVSRNNRIFCLHSNNDLEKDTERSKLFLNQENTEQFLKEVEEKCQKHQEVLQKLKKTNFSQLSDQGIFELFVNTTDSWSLVISYFRASQAQTTYHINKEIKKHFSEQELATLIVSPELDPINEELLDWQKILQQEYSVEKLIEHTEKHPWIVAVHFSKEDVIDTLTQKYNNDKKHLKFIDLVKEKQELKEKQEQILDQKPQLKIFVESAQKIALSRIKLKSCWAGTDYYLILLFEEISKRTNESVHDINKFYLIEEIDALLKGERLSEEEKENRKRCFVGLWKEGKATYVSGDEAEALAKKELKDLYETDDKDELKGTVAHPGKFIGIARILESNNVEQLRELRKSFKKGDVLVTQMTQPNIMDIAMKAGALVTDEGGTLSHAAIISREFGMPCIVGTSTSTTTFKDGDLVEVDANKGIVRKIG